MRRLTPALLLLLAVACDEEGKIAGGQGGPGGKQPAGVPQKPPPLPTTGSPQIREMRERLLDDVEAMEKEIEAGKKPESRFVVAARKQVEILLTTTRMAVDREAEEAVRREHSMLRGQQAALDKARSDLAEGIVEIQGYLDGIERGVGKPPEGFTVDELKDRLGRRQEELRALEKQEAEVRARMQEKEELLAKGGIEARGPTVLTHEMEAARELKARIEALEARLPK
jgi:hypothetical protein